MPWPTGHCPLYGCLYLFQLIQPAGRFVPFQKPWPTTFRCWGEPVARLILCQEVACSNLVRCWKVARYDFALSVLHFRRKKVYVGILRLFKYYCSLSEALRVCLTRPRISTSLAPSVSTAGFRWLLDVLWPAYKAICNASRSNSVNSSRKTAIILIQKENCGPHRGFGEHENHRWSIL
jgi:hypothetical protein